MDIIKFFDKIPVVIKIFVILDAVLISVLFFCSSNPLFVEKYYSLTIYPYITFFMGRFTDIFVFSLTEIIIIVCFLIIITRIIIGFVRILTGKAGFKKVMLKFSAQTFITASAVIMVFYLMWGFNYFRKEIEFTEKPDNDYSDEYFDSVLNYIIKQTNDLYIRPEYKFSRINDDINIEIKRTIQSLSKKDINPAKRVKFSLFNILESTNTLGVISPFLLESHVSKELLNYEIPSVLAHEKSHLFGYANEAEANLIAFLTCINSKDRYFQYSGYCDILPYFLITYKSKHTKEEYKLIIDKLRKEIKSEYDESRIRYERHDTIVNKIFIKIYDFYLKVNNVKEGTGSYSLVAELILKNRLINP
jgi:hypothetical protein